MSALRLTHGLTHGLAHRDVELRELMDDPDCDLGALRRTYGQFGAVNRLVAGWSWAYRRMIRPLLDPSRISTLLDIGSGAGDVPRALAGWATRDGLALQITAIDPDERAYRYALDQQPVAGVSFRCTGSSELVAEGASFDLVTSNHLLHHLDDRARDVVLADSARLTRRRAIHSDIARHRLAYGAYGLASLPFGRRSFIRVDGLRSIRRSYRAEELQAAVPPPWHVRRHGPARLFLVLDRAEEGRADE